MKNLYARDGKCHNSEPGTFNHECGKPATWIGTKTNGFQSGFCDHCREHGYEAKPYVTWQRIIKLDTHQRIEVRHAVTLAMEYWPNAHLGERSRLQDMRSAFRRIRNKLNHGLSFGTAIGEVADDAFRHRDM